MSSAPDEQRQWHRLFAMGLTDFFYGQPVTVEPEVDLSHQQQLLDVVVLRKEAVPLTCEMPDGFEELAPYNLITFKSHQEALDARALRELFGHQINYSKLVTPRGQPRPPESDFKLFGVCVRFPQKLNEQCTLKKVKDGVFRVGALDVEVRVVVVHHLPEASRNALLHLFSLNEKQWLYAAREYRPRSSTISSFLFQLYDRYREEGMPMPFTKEQFIRESLEKLAKEPFMRKLVRDDLTAEECLEGVPVEKRLEGVPVEKIREVVPLKKLLEGYPAEELRALLEERDQPDQPTDAP